MAQPQGHGLELRRSVASGFRLAFDPTHMSKPPALDSVPDFTHRGWQVCLDVTPAPSESDSGVYLCTAWCRPGSQAAWQALEIRHQSLQFSLEAARKEAEERLRARLDRAPA